MLAATAEGDQPAPDAGPGLDAGDGVVVGMGVHYSEGNCVAPRISPTTVLILPMESGIPLLPRQSLTTTSGKCRKNTGVTQLHPGMYRNKTVKSFGNSVVVKQVCNT